MSEEGGCKCVVGTRRRFVDGVREEDGDGDGEEEEEEEGEDGEED